MEVYRLVLRYFSHERIMIETPRFNEFMDCLVKALEEHPDWTIEHSTHYSDVLDALVNKVTIKKVVR